ELKHGLIFRHLVQGISVTPAAAPSVIEIDITVVGLFEIIPVIATEARASPRYCPNYYRKCEGIQCALYFPSLEFVADSWTSDSSPSPSSISSIRVST